MRLQQTALEVNQLQYIKNVYHPNFRDSLKFYVFMAMEPKLWFYKFRCNFITIDDTRLYNKAIMPLLNKAIFHKSALWIIERIWYSLDNENKSILPPVLDLWLIAFNFSLLLQRKVHLAAFWQKNASAGNLIKGFALTIEAWEKSNAAHGSQSLASRQ